MADKEEANTKYEKKIQSTLKRSIKFYLLVVKKKNLKLAETTTKKNNRQ
jgi:hypothetical protein